MAFVELPAHNVWVDPDTGAVHVGGLEALATRGEASGYMSFRWSTNAVQMYVGGGMGIADGADQVGFGLWMPPEGAVVGTMNYVAEGFVVGPTREPDQSYYSGGYANLPVVRIPCLLALYTGAGTKSNLSTFPSDTPGDVVSTFDLVHNIFGDEYVLGDPATGGIGLTPTLFLDVEDYFADTTVLGTELRLTYLAVRINYTLPDEPSGTKKQSARHFVNRHS